MKNDKTLQMWIDKYFLGQEQDEESKDLKNNMVQFDDEIQRLLDLKEDYEKIKLPEDFNPYRKAFTSKYNFRKLAAIIIVFIGSAVFYYLLNTNNPKDYDLTKNWSKENFHEKIIILERIETQNLNVSSSEWVSLLLMEKNPNVKLYALQIIKGKQILSISQRNRILTNETNPLIKIGINQL